MWTHISLVQRRFQFSPLNERETTTNTQKKSRNRNKARKNRYTNSATRSELNTRNIIKFLFKLDKEDEKNLLRISIVLVETTWRRLSNYLSICAFLRLIEMFSSVEKLLEKLFSDGFEGPVTTAHVPTTNFRLLSWKVIKAFFLSPSKKKSSNWKTFLISFWLAFVYWFFFCLFLFKKIFFLFTNRKIITRKIKLKKMFSNDAKVFGGNFQNWWINFGGIWLGFCF